MKMSNAGGFSQKSRELIALAGLTIAVLAVASFTPDAMAQATFNIGGGSGGGGMAIPTTGKSIGTIAGNLTASIRGAAVLVNAVSYLGAFTFAFLAALKWKAHSEAPDRTPLKVPVTYMAIAAMMAALPEVLGTGIISLWGSNANVVTQP